MAAVEVVVWWIALTGLWVVTVSPLTVWEVGAAVLLALPCALLATGFRVAVGCRWRIRARWLLRVPPVALRVVVDTARLPFSGARGERAEVPVPGEAEESRRAARHALKSAALGATPSTVVLDDDVAGDRIVVHRVVVRR